jgi:hypothetical protein
MHMWAPANPDIERERDMNRETTLSPPPDHSVACQLSDGALGCTSSTRCKGAALDPVRPKVLEIQFF